MGNYSRHHFLGEVGGKLILHCNFGTRKLPIYLPDFYKECLEVWSDLNTTNVVSYDDVVNQTIWNNKHILIEKRPCFIKYLVDHGILKIGDLISNTSRFLESEKILCLQLSPIHYFKLMGVINAIPNEWRLIIKQSQQHIYSLSIDTIQISIDGINVNLLKVNSKMIYNEFKRKKQTAPSAQIKLNNKCPELSMGWKKVCSLPLTVTLETKVREFQYNFFNSGAPAREARQRSTMGKKFW